jgi:hypothetical protein
VKRVRIGDERLTVAGKQIVATHYRLFAQAQRDVWYDASGRWVKLIMVAEDGSILEWVLK